MSVSVQTEVSQTLCSGHSGRGNSWKQGLDEHWMPVKRLLLLLISLLALLAGQATAVHMDEQEMKRADEYLKQRGLNKYGDRSHTAYTGGTPLFDERTGVFLLLLMNECSLLLKVSFFAPFCLLGES